MTEQKKANELSKKVRPQKEISEIAQSTFYLSWTYSAIRNMTASTDYRTVDAIAKRLNLSRGSIQQIVDFLLQNGLCVSEKSAINQDLQERTSGASRT